MSDILRVIRNDRREGLKKFRAFLGGKWRDQSIHSMYMEHVHQFVFILTCTVLTPTKNSLARAGFELALSHLQDRNWIRIATNPR